MKKLQLFVLCLVLVACSCEPKPQPEPEPEPTPEPTPEIVTPGPGDYFFVLPQNSSKSTWEAGDKIMVQGNYAPGAITVTIAASDIQADGRTAKVHMDVVPDTFFTPDYLHAAYPAELLDMEENMFCDDIFNFTQTNRQLMCAWLGDNNTFSFMDICGAVTFSVDGDWDSCTLAGPAWEMVSYTGLYAVAVNSQTQNWCKNYGLMDYFLVSDIEDGNVTLFFPGGISLPNGFVVYFKKGDEYPKRYTYSNAVNLAHDGLLELGNITASLQDYSGPKPESPEMPVYKSYSRFTVGVTEISGLCLTADGSALWAVGDNGYLGQVSFDGQTTKFWSKDADMEGITIDPETGDIYIALEDSSDSNLRQAVARVKAPDYDKSSFEVLFKVPDAKNYGNSGLEGITFFRNNTILTGSQVDANVFNYTLEGEQLFKVSLRKLTKSAITEVGGLCYDPVNDWLWVTDSETHKLYVLDGDLTHILASYSVPFCSNNEAVLVDHINNCVWVGNDDDTPRVYRLEFEGL